MSCNGMSRSFRGGGSPMKRCALACIVSLVVGGMSVFLAEAEDDILYSVSPNASEQNELVVYLKDRTHLHDRTLSAKSINAELDTNILVVRTEESLSVVDIVGIIYDSTEFFGGADKAEAAGVSELWVLWGATTAGGAVHSYENGVMVDSALLSFVSGSGDPVRALSRLGSGVVRMFPEDKYEDADDSRDGASNSFGEDHTLTRADEDWFVYQAKSAGTHVIETKRVPGKSLVDTMIDVEAGAYRTSDDDGGDDTLYSRVVLTAEQHETILISVRGYNEGATGYYRLYISNISGGDRVNGDEADDTREQARSLNVGSDIAGTLRPVADVDWYEMHEMKRGETYIVEFRSEEYGMRAKFHAGTDEEANLEIVPWVNERFVLRSRGPYFVEVSGAVGDYRLAIKRDVAAPL